MGNRPYSFELLFPCKILLRRPVSPHARSPSSERRSNEAQYYLTVGRPRHAVTGILLLSRRRASADVYSPHQTFAVVFRTGFAEVSHQTYEQCSVLGCYPATYHGQKVDAVWPWPNLRGHGSGHVQPPRLGRPPHDRLSRCHGTEQTPSVCCTWPICKTMIDG